MIKRNLEEKIFNIVFYEKCLKCQCLRETLDTIKKQLYSVSDNDSLSLLKKVVSVESQLLEPQYT
jgi:hypothetical protein